jgi:hypothetical protein
MRRQHVRFEVFTAVTMKNGIFWVVMPCGYCKNRRSMRRLLVTASFVPSSPILVTLMSSSETSVLIRATRRNIPEDTILYSHRRENLRSYTDSNEDGKWRKRVLCLEIRKEHKVSPFLARNISLLNDEDMKERDGFKLHSSEEAFYFLAFPFVASVTLVERRERRERRNSICVIHTLLGPLLRPLKVLNYLTTYWEGAAPEGEKDWTR